MATLPIVRTLLEQGCWWAPHELQKAVLYLGGPMVSDAALTARIRDLRKIGLSIQARPRKKSCAWEYRLDS